MSECICLSCGCVPGEGGGVRGCLKAGVAHVHMRCMSGDCSRRHGKIQNRSACRTSSSEPSEKVCPRITLLLWYFGLRGGKKTQKPHPGNTDCANFGLDFKSSTLHLDEIRKKVNLTEKK